MRRSPGIVAGLSAYECASGRKRKRRHRYTNVGLARLPGIINEDTLKKKKIATIAVVPRTSPLMRCRYIGISVCVRRGELVCYYRSLELSISLMRSPTAFL